jgi:hypothetical protein
MKFFVDGPAFTPSAGLIAATITDILLACVKFDESEQGVVHLASWKESGPAGVGYEISTAEFPSPGHQFNVHNEAARARIEEAVASSLASTFLAPGGAVLLVYSAILTRGEAQVRLDCAAETGVCEGALICGPNSICSMELVSLLMCGVARANVSAYHAVSRQLQPSWDGARGVGMLSTSELDSGQPLADSLKSPSSPVWVVHGGDHFTVLYSAEDQCSVAVGKAGAADTSAEDAWRPPATAPLYHWNGLPPLGPRMASIQLQATRRSDCASEGDVGLAGCVAAPPAPAVQEKRLGKCDASETEDCPKIISILRTKWPSAQLIDFDGSVSLDLPSV